MLEAINAVLDNVAHRMPELLVSLSETFLMVGIALGAAILVGIPVGTLLYLTRKGGLVERPRLFALFDILVNVVRSFPFMILIVALIPVTRFLLGTSLGTVAASVPLSIVAIVYYGRLVEQSLLDVDRGVITAAVSMGATLPEIVFKVLLVEARSGIVYGLTIATISFLSFSTLAGAVGGGGIGDFAIRYGYFRFETDTMVFTIVVIVLLVQLIQFSGSRLSRVIDKR
ncbi:ACB transport system, membrane protein [Caballeronia cordobensis]|uniref:ACB transport system, membrane protein n=1 Tax=Caballeronia cordobensis TaxID=1353886 RepID=A0A158GNN3_CABCO|nr:methionine ABC transporter permease [Caballeronia cordobensis]SAL33467.1 ACB transport system, membrane protein [Caballeronia cordobensis]